MHSEPHPFAGKTVKLKDGTEYRLEDWWDRCGQGRWMHCDNNIACLQYAMRVAVAGYPIDDEVVYGKIEGLGNLIHVSQLDL